jgi:hypothetical protein
MRALEKLNDAFQVDNEPSYISAFDTEVGEWRSALLAHPLFHKIQNISQMRQFMEAHVFAVWDFMSLLKTLQNQLTCTKVPWSPPTNSQAARFINEIVLGEETDVIQSGEPTSHFELYLAAMKQCGARISKIETFARLLAEGGTVEVSLIEARAPEYVRDFVASTMSFCTLRPHEVASAFLYGREDIIPEMFKRLLRDAPLTNHANLKTLKLYLDRHIEVDGDSHGPMARKLMQCLCGSDPIKWAEASKVARKALQARCMLWDGVLAAIITHE